MDSSDTITYAACSEVTQDVRERWRVTLPADTPVAERDRLLLEAMDGDLDHATFVDRDIESESERVLHYCEPVTVAESRQDSRAHVVITRWTCIAADHDGAVDEDRIGERTIDLEIRVPRATNVPETDRKAHELALAIAALINGTVGTCAGGIFGNSYTIQVSGRQP